MIIKSLTRKKPDFEGLLNYIFHGASDKVLSITNNLSFTGGTPEEERESIIRQFIENDSLLKIKSKSYNRLFHEIISLPVKKNIEPSYQKKILFDLVHSYIEKRGERLLVYGNIHQDHEHHLHAHLMLSVNDLNNEKRLLLSKERFKQIKKELEIELILKYPDLEYEPIHSRKENLEKDIDLINHRKRQKEFELVKRAGK